MIWKIGACGEYADYKLYTIIKQDHPMLLKYEICYGENEYSDLEHIDVANTLDKCKKIIDERTIKCLMK